MKWIIFLWCLLDILVECEIEPFCGSIRIVVGEEMGKVRRQKGSSGLPRGERASEAKGDESESDYYCYYCKVKVVMSL